VPFILAPDGQTVYVPGVYDLIQVRSSLAGPLPAFHIPVIMGRCWEGHPYNADSLKEAVENDFTPFKLVKTDGAAGAYFGVKCELHRALQFGKRHGLPFAYAVCLSALTRASVLVTSTGPVSQMTLFPRKFGAPPGWTGITWDSVTEILTITPVKRFAMLAANASNVTTRYYVEGNHGWLAEGAIVRVGSNIVAAVQKTIVSVGTERAASGQLSYFIELDSTVGTALATANYALVFQHDEVNTEVFTGITTGQAFIDAINNFSKLLVATKHANFTDAKPITTTLKPLIEVAAWGAVTDGASPAPTDTDLDDFITLLQGGEWANFAIREQVIPQTYLLVSSDSTQHAAMRDYAAAERQRGYPISVTAGCAWGDTDLSASNTTNPKVRAAALNSDSFCLVANGMDDEAPYISRAAAVWGRRVQGGPAHNLTNDRFINVSDEVEWDEIVSGELSSLCRSGVVTNKLSIGQTIAYKLSQGLTTLQANAVIWNEEDATTFSAMQRDLADFVSRVIKTDFEEFLVGADEVDPNAVSAVLIRRAEKSLQKRKFIKSFSIQSVTINDAGSGYDVEWSVVLPVTNDFMTVVTTILVGPT
jgi:hypothetical protein